MQDLNRELVIARAARAVGVSEAALYKAGEDPAESGKALSTEKLSRYIAFAAGEPKPAVQTLLDELLSHLIPQNRKIVREETVKRLSEEIQALMTGGRAEYANQETLLVCDGCGDPLQVIAAQNGRLSYICRGCGR